jgi:hypothetical protein
MESQQHWQPISARYHCSGKLRARALCGVIFFIFFNIFRMLFSSFISYVVRQLLSSVGEVLCGLCVLCVDREHASNSTTNHCKGEVKVLTVCEAKLCQSAHDRTCSALCTGVLLSLQQKTAWLLPGRMSCIGTASCMPACMRVCMCKHTVGIRGMQPL